MANIIKPPQNEFGEWAIDEKEWDWLESVIRERNIGSVVEFGTGTSTKLFNQLVTDLVCYEDYEPKFDKLSGCVKIRYTKGQHIDPIERIFDFAFIDTAPEIIEDVMGHAKIIAVHDSKRPNERNVINNFLSKWERIECPNSDRGLSLFIKPQKVVKPIESVRPVKKRILSVKKKPTMKK